MSNFKTTYPNLNVVSKTAGRDVIPQAIDVTAAIYKEHPEWRLLSEPVTAIGHCIPPRVGKTSVIIGSVLELRALGAPPVVVITPWLNLCEQLTTDDKVMGAMSIYGMRAKGLAYQWVTKVDDSEWWKREGTSADYFTMTMGLVHNAVSGGSTAFLDGLSEAADLFGARPVVIIDEIHLIAETKKWGATIQRLIDNGVFVVGLTGTPERNDNYPVPGFTAERVSDEEPIEKKLFKSVVEVKDDVRYGEFQNYVGVAAKYEVAPIKGVNVPWSKAFDEGWMNHINFIGVDVDLDDGRKLIDLDQQELSKNLRHILESDEACVPVLECVLDRLNTWRGRQKKYNSTPLKTQALIVSGSDYDTEKNGTNYHARELRRHMKQLLEIKNGQQLGGQVVEWQHLHNLRIEIASSSENDGTPSKASAEKIKGFVAGDIDVLIVKNMGLVGLDAPQCKVQALLGAIRRGPLARQMVTRTCTKWGQRGVEGMAGDVIYPRDIMHEALFSEISKNQPTNITTMEPEGDPVIQPLEDREDDERHATGAAIASYTTVGGVQYEGNRETLLRTVKHKYEIARKLSDVEIIQTVEQGGFPVEDHELLAQEQVKKKQEHIVIKNLNRELDSKKGEFGKTANTLTNKLCDYKNNPAKWRATLRSIQFEAKKFCGFYGSVPSLEDPALLGRLIDALEPAYRKVKREM